MVLGRLSEQNLTSLLTDEAYRIKDQMKDVLMVKYRLVQNTTGMWIIQELQRDWPVQGEEVGFGGNGNINEVTDNQTWIHPNDPVSLLLRNGNKN